MKNFFFGIRAAKRYIYLDSQEGEKFGNSKFKLNSLLNFLHFVLFFCTELHKTKPDDFLPMFKNLISLIITYQDEKISDFRIKFITNLSSQKYPNSLRLNT
ncbi:hypothetical protein BpHYR1_034501 [Brachionus plicatilis]|uniref:Uncharacterized protein n=1 Tax=Brachionus plicatilis TaxID=10195 RepID=A0A3M7RPG6_BRAPC|nr:hypothetical protein BpHYR1_034501 [Brachionus plicatilis]